MKAWMKWVGGAVAFVLVLALGVWLGRPSGSSQDLARNPPPQAVCPKGMDCTPQKTAAEKQLEELRKEVAELKKAPPAPTPSPQANAPVATPVLPSPFIDSAPPGHHVVGATKGRNVGKDGTSCESRGGKIVPDMSKGLEKTGKGFRRPNKCTADA